MLTEDDTEKIDSIRSIVSAWFIGETIDDYEALEVYEEIQIMI